MAHSHAGGGCCGPSGSSSSAAAAGADATSAAPSNFGRATDAAMDATQALLRDLEDMTFDPALEGCCRRDVQQSIRSGRVKLALQASDRAAAAARLRAGAVVRDPRALAAAVARAGNRGGRSGGDEEGDLSSGSGGAGSDDYCTPASALGDARTKQGAQAAAAEAAGAAGSPPAGDGELAALRAARLAQLRAAAAARGGARDAGYGRLNDLAADKLLPLLEELGGRAVVHLAAEGAPACDHLDEQLASLAHTYRGTYFARVPLRRGAGGGAGGGAGIGPGSGAAGALCARLGLSELPALVALRAGAVVGRAPVARFGGGGDVIEEEVFGYLYRLRVLSEGGGGGGGGRGGGGGGGGAAGGGGGSGSDAGSSDEGEGGAAPCEMCGRTFPHEHIRAIYRGDGDGDSSGSDGER